MWRSFCFLFFFNMAFASGTIHNLFQTGDVSSGKQNKVFTVHYLPVKTVSQWLKQGNKSLLGANGTVKIDTVDNKIWVSAEPKNIKQIAALLTAMDRPKQQILIKAKIIDIDNYYAQTIGGRLGQYQDLSDNGWGVAMHEVHGSSAKIPIVKTGGFNLNYTLQALIDQGHAILVAAPTLLTKNRVKADIEAGEEVPYQEKSGTGNTSVTFKKAVLGLQVTPTILPNHKVSLLVHISQDQLSGLDFQGVPAIQTQQLTTNATVIDGNSLVLGGIQQTVQGHMQQGIPIIRHIPIIGWILSAHEKKHSKKQLIVVITPKIIND